MIKVKNLTFAYSGSSDPVLKNVNFNLKKGKITMLLGLSGAGKTTLISTLNGVIPKFFPGKLEGEVIVNGVDVKGKEVHEMCDHIGLVFQDPALQLVSLTVFGDLSFGPSNIGLPRDEIIERVEEVIKLCNLDGFEARNPEDLSGGEQQKVAIARALINNPVLVLADEPTGALDSENSTEIMRLLVKMNKKRKSTFVFVSHDMNIARYGKRTIILKDGRVIGDTDVNHETFEEISKKLGEDTLDDRRKRR